MAVDRDLVAALRRTELFSGVGDKALRSVAAQARTIDHPAGREITEQGSGASGFHLIVEGSATGTVHGQTRPDLGPGDYFGKISLIDGEPRSATVRAATPLPTVSLASWSFQPILREQPEVAVELLKVLCRRLRAVEG